MCSPCKHALHLAQSSVQLPWVSNRPYNNKQPDRMRMSKALRHAVPDNIQRPRTSMQCRRHSRKVAQRNGQAAGAGALQRLQRTQRKLARLWRADAAHACAGRGLQKRTMGHLELLKEMIHLV